MNWRTAPLLVALAALNLGSSCDDPDPPPDDRFDGNVVVGDGSTTRDANEDAAVDAATDAALDLGMVDVGFLDAESMDREPPMPRDASIRCDTPPSATLTATAAAARVDMLGGMVVEVVGTATVVNLRCTAMACSPAMPCCNQCNAAVALDGVLQVLANPCYRNPGCTGDECRVACQPQTLGFPQRFRGLLGRGVNGEPGIELFGVR